MSMVSLKNCVDNTKGLIPNNVPVSIFSLHEAVDNPKDKDLTLKNKNVILTLDDFIKYNPPWAQMYEWILEVDGFLLHVGTPLLKLNFETWRDAREERLINTVQAVVTQWGNHAYENVLSKALDTLKRPDLRNHPQIVRVFKCAELGHNYRAEHSHSL